MNIAIDLPESASRPELDSGGPLYRKLIQVGRTLFSNRLEIGLGVTAVALPFVRPTLATTPWQVCLKAGGLCLVLAGLAVRVWSAGFAGRHTRSSKIEGSKLATAGPYAYVRNPIYLGSIILGFGMVLVVGDRRFWLPCALTFLGLYFGLIPAEEEFLSRKFKHEYLAYRQNVPRLLPQFTPWSKSLKTPSLKIPFDLQAARGEWRLALILAGILGVFWAFAGIISHRTPKKNLSAR
jgi:protein-S-isoprenylcysteine O-methyltransferase Ste14